MLCRLDLSLNCCPVLRGWECGWRGFPPVAKVTFVSRDIPDFPLDGLESLWVCSWRHQGAFWGAVLALAESPAPLWLCQGQHPKHSPWKSSLGNPWESFQELWARFRSGNHCRNQWLMNIHGKMRLVWLWGLLLQRGSVGLGELGNSLHSMCIKFIKCIQFMGTPLLFVLRFCCCGCRCESNSSVIRPWEAECFHGSIFKGLQQFVVPAVTNFVGTL